MEHESIPQGLRNPSAHYSIKMSLNRDEVSVGINDDSCHNQERLVLRVRYSSFIDIN